MRIKRKLRVRIGYEAKKTRYDELRSYMINFAVQGSQEVLHDNYEA